MTAQKKGRFGIKYYNCENLYITETVALLSNKN